MDTFILAALALLGALAVIALFVGVSNDAVNFLNSAVGSRTAPFWVIMTVASLGVLLGATFSSGMMEVARTGVLVPEHFTFKEVIIVFTAVMVCDVLLLNAFNSLGLPTSTTVSIVFELFGGATALACYKVWSSGAPIADLGLYLNSAKALAMIMAILVSVVVAFFAGLFVQYLLRLIFSFNYERYYKLFGGIYGMKEREIKSKTERILHELGLEQERNTPVRSLPLGWKQKLAFSVSIFHDPKVVFLDEPTGGVDPVTRRQFWGMIYEAAGRGITVFVTTHYMDEAEYCDRVSIMVDGVIADLDTPAALKQRYQAADMDAVFRKLAYQAKRE